MNSREQVTASILNAKNAKNVSYHELATAANLSPAFVTAAILGQQTLPAEAALSLGKLLDLPTEVVDALQQIPIRGSIPESVPTDPTIYRFYEILQVYGTTLKALVNEMFGDGIISAIDFKLDIQKVETPEGARARITLDGKFLPYRPF